MDYTYITYAISMIVLGVWNLLLVALSYIAWKHVRHWSTLVILIAMGLVAGEQSLVMLRSCLILLDFFAPSVEGIEDYQLFYTIETIAKTLAYIVGIIGGIGALVALRKKGWSIQALRNPVEAA